MKKKSFITAIGLVMAFTAVMTGCTSYEAKANNEAKPDTIYLTTDTVSTAHGDLLCLKPDMDNLTVDLVCLSIPDARNDSIILVFAGAFTDIVQPPGHINVASDHVAGGVKYQGYECTRNTGAFTWSDISGPQIQYLNNDNMLAQASLEGGMGFAQEMMIHNGMKVKTTRPLDNRHQFRALCQDSQGNVLIYESKEVLAFGDFIDALLEAGVSEALYTDMGGGWNYCFYRQRPGEQATFLHDRPEKRASNFVVFTAK